MNMELSRNMFNFFRYLDTGFNHFADLSETLRMFFPAGWTVWGIITFITSRSSMSVKDFRPRRDV